MEGSPHRRATAPDSTNSNSTHSADSTQAGQDWWGLGGTQHQR